MSSGLRSDVLVLQVREGVGGGGGGGPEEMSPSSHVLWSPVQELVQRCLQRTEHLVKCRAKMRLRIPADKQETHLTLKECLRQGINYRFYWQLYGTCLHL